MATKTKDEILESISSMSVMDLVELIDAIEVVIHIFHPEKRSSYNLEKMWEDILPKQQITV